MLRPRSSLRFLCQQASGKVEKLRTKSMMFCEYWHLSFLCWKLPFELWTCFLEIESVELIIYCWSLDLFWIKCANVDFLQAFHHLVDCTGIWSKLLFFGESCCRVTVTAISQPSIFLHRGLQMSFPKPLQETPIITRAGMMTVMGKIGDYLF